MKVLIDTNILIDILTDRGEFTKQSVSAVRQCLLKSSEVFVTCSSVIDIMYILRKELKSEVITKDVIHNFLVSFSIADVLSEFVESAFDSDISYFEDAVISKTAEAVGASYIITRNKSDFIKSKIPAVTPVEFLDIR